MSPVGKAMRVMDKASVRRRPTLSPIHPNMMLPSGRKTKPAFVHEGPGRKQRGDRDLSRFHAWTEGHPVREAGNPATRNEMCPGGPTTTPVNMPQSPSHAAKGSLGGKKSCCSTVASELKIMNLGGPAGERLYRVDSGLGGRPGRSGPGCWNGQVPHHATSCKVLATA
jgi:hypothetical protein